MADRAGFEPAETFLPHTLSKRAHSTTLPPVLGDSSVDGGRKLPSYRGIGNSFFRVSGH